MQLLAQVDLDDDTVVDLVRPDLDDVFFALTEVSSMTVTTLHPVQDSITMLRRRLLHLRRYPSLTMMLVGQPVLFLLLFVGVFGGTLGNGLGPAVGGRAEYLHFLVPGIIVMAVSSVAVGTVRVGCDGCDRAGSSPGSAPWRSPRRRC